MVVYAIWPASLSSNRNEMTRAQMLEALTALDRQLESAAQPLDRAQSDLVIDALGQDVFSGGVFGRLTGAYPGCKTNKALRSISGGVVGTDGPEERVRTLLEKRADQLGQIRRHLRIRALLEVWLFIHIPATIALLAALLAHVVSVFYYW